MSATLKLTPSRIDSLDLVRGIIMVLMLLDHARDFFHQYAMIYEPEDLTQTTPIIFFTRWITHLCAPAFVFLAGISAFLYGNKVGTRKELQKFLVTRGVFLILLEETVISIAWRFSIDLTTIRGLVIWGLGWSMIFLAGLVYLNKKSILWISIIILGFHNLLDPIHFDNKILQAFWSFFHQQDKIQFLSDPNNPDSVIFTWRILYPVLPMIGLMGLGYYLGAWYKNDFKADIRQGMLFNTGLIFISVFVLLRFLQYVFIQYDYIFYLNPNDLVSDSDSNNVYVFKSVRYALKNFLLYFTGHFGDASPMVVQGEAVYTFLSFLNVSKYPFSLFFILVTIGPLMILLSVIETTKLPTVLNKVFKTLGSVPLFYYIIHLFLLRLIAFLIVLIFYNSKIKLIASGSIAAFSQIAQFNIFMVYLLTLLCVALMYPLCLFYSQKKKTGKYWIYSYI